MMIKAWRIPTKKNIYMQPVKKRSSVNEKRHYRCNVVFVCTMLCCII